MKKRHETKEETLLGALPSQARRWGVCALLIAGMVAGGALIQGCQTAEPPWCSIPGHDHVYVGQGDINKYIDGEKVACYPPDGPRRCAFCGKPEPEE